MEGEAAGAVALTGVGWESLIGGFGDRPTLEILADRVARGVNWLSMGGDLSLMLRAAARAIRHVREQMGPREEAP